MKLETFFENFEFLTDAPNAIAKLREIILQLAVKGKLVPQDSNDEAASLLMNHIIQQRKSLISQGKLKEENLLSISDDELLHSIPSNWIWTRLGEVVNYSGSKKVSPDEIHEDSWLLDLEDIQKDTSRILAKKTFADKDSKSTKAQFKAGDVLYGKLRPYLNKVVVADADGFCTTEIVPLQPYEGVIPEYIKYVLKRPDFLNYVNSKTYGINLPRLGTEDGRRAIFPLPPTTEQKRIVEKCDRLLSICDEIEKRQQQRQESIVRMNESAIAQLLSSQNPDEFRQHWQRICNNFDLLYSIPETIPKLRQAILQLAVQGKLVRQDPNDERAQVLLKKVEAEKQELIKAKKLKKQWSFSQITDDEAPYKIPDTWKWIRILEGVKSVTVGHVGSMQNEYVDEGIPFLRCQNVRENRFEFLGLKFISPKFHDKLLKSKLQPNDVVVVRSGNVGTTCVIPETLKEANCADLVIIKNPMAIVPHFLSYYMNSAAKTYVKEGTVGIALTHFNTESVAALPIPLPPLAEQKRIVEKCDRLMSLCDTLEAKLKQGRDSSEKLMEVAAKQVMNYPDLLRPRSGFLQPDQQD